MGLRIGNIGLVDLAAIGPHLTHADEPLHICGTLAAATAPAPDLDPTAQIYASINDLFNFHFVESNSEYVSAARGSFEHFEYNRVIGNRLVGQGYVPCVSLVKTGARDFGNGNIYSNYFVQAAFTKAGAAEPDYVLSSLYLAGSVQSLEGTLSQKPWYMMEAKKTDTVLLALAASSNFRSVTSPATFNPVTIVKDENFIATSGAEVYDQLGVTYTPVYGSGARFGETLYLVTWGLTIPGTQTPSAAGAFVRRNATGQVSVAPLSNVTEQIVVPLDQIRAASYPQKPGGADPSDAELQSAVLGLSKL